MRAEIANLVEDLPAYATALIAPLEQPIFVGSNSIGARILGWMSENRSHTLLTEYKLGKGRVIVWGIDYYQMGELQQVTLLHRLAEYLRSPNKTFVPLSMGVKNIIRPITSPNINQSNNPPQEIIRPDKDQFLHIVYTKDS